MASMAMILSLLQLSMDGFTKWTDGGAAPLFANKMIRAVLPYGNHGGDMTFLP